MISWERRKDLIGRRDPRQLRAQLNTLIESGGWQYICEMLETVAQEKRSRCGRHTLSLDDAHQVKIHNENVLLADAFEAVPQLLQAAKEACESRLD